jgi:hypothetical protein
MNDRDSAYFSKASQSSTESVGSYYSNDSSDPIVPVEEQAASKEKKLNHFLRRPYSLEDEFLPPSHFTAADFLSDIEENPFISKK